jgi:hypothetical protein
MIGTKKRLAKTIRGTALAAVPLLIATAAGIAYADDFVIVDPNGDNSVHISEGGTGTFTVQLAPKPALTRLKAATPRPPPL